MKTNTTPSKTKTAVPKKDKADFTVVAIGASAGGLEAVSILLKNLPADTGMAYIYVQHLSPNHKSFLTSILSKLTTMKVQEIENMEYILPNNVYIIPPDKEIEVIDGHIQLFPRSDTRTINLTIDFLFSSLAETHKSNVVGVILSGYASDGVIGMKAIKAAGGITIAQDNSAQAGSMPNSAIAAGVVDFVLSPKEIAAELVHLGKVGLKGGLESRKKTDTEEKTGREIILESYSMHLNSIFEMLLKKTGVDFSHYKMPTIKRRIAHKMQQANIKTIKEYVAHLRENHTEVDSLYKDLLINVTSFFRDKEAFEYLEHTLLPNLLDSKQPEETIRMWVPACSTGEEAYTIAMLVAELQTSRGTKFPVQIFATDLSESAIRTARIGEYPKSDVKPVPQKYLDSYFTKNGDKYRINKDIREMCVFAPHNILRDPPFSRMDFISCCNILIYFDSTAQKKVFATLYFALKEGAYLMLGKAETIGTASPFFTRINTRFKIYSRKKNTGIHKMLELTPRFPKTQMQKKVPTTVKTPEINPSGIENAIDSLLLTNYMPACAVVNKDMEILQFRGPVSSYLEHPSGRASLNILKMARPEFAFELRNAIHVAIQTKMPVHKTGMEIKIDNVMRLMSFDVSPLKIEDEEPLMLIVFSFKEQVEKFVENDSQGKSTSIVKDRKIKQLTEELNNTRTEMISIIESQEVTYEELQSANEEIVSSNEEFQSLNEELETSKEEIEATNEELISTNHELQLRNELLMDSQEYSDALFATIHEPMLVLHKDFEIMSANKSFYKKFRLKKEEVEGKKFFELGAKQWDIPKLQQMLKDVISKGTSFDNLEISQNFATIGEKTMLLNAHPIVQKTHSEKLILLAIEDITDRITFFHKEREMLRREKEIAEVAVRSKQQFLSNMSHEIRTPMNAIIGFTNVVLKTELSAKQKEYLMAIKMSGDALIVLINDILDLAKVDSGKMSFESIPFKISDSITSMLHLFDTKIKEKNIELVIDYDKKIPEQVIGDPIRLHQIVLNLVSNAVKFTPTGKITVTVKLLSQDEKQATVQFKVKDTGIGIPEDHLDSIFENFHQAAQHTTRMYGGTGLGLAIVKKLVEAQDGNISVESKIDKGSTFTFILSYQKTSDPVKSEGIAVPVDSKVGNIKILVVEDMPLNQLLMKTLLDDFGFEHECADNGKEAIEKLQTATYDIVLMDLQMPIMNGFEATDHIRNKMKSTIPIIALTADVTTVDVEKCKAAGMDDYLAKPVDEKILYNKITSYINKQLPPKQD